jgi:hypothetical protein
MSVNKPNKVPNDSLLTPYTIINGVVTPLGQSVSTFLTGTTSARPSIGNIGDLYFNQTINELQIYTTNGWVSVSTPPLAPTTVVGVNNPIAYGGTPSDSVRFTPALSGTPAATYTVTSTPGGITATGASSPITVPGLTSGTAYTFTVTASNSYGSATSAASASITAGTVPPAPTTVAAVQLSSVSASVSFASPTNTGGSPITSYTVTSSPGGVSVTGSSSPIVVSGLATNTTYTFNVVANSSTGPSAASVNSNSLFIGSGFGLVSVNNTSGSTLTNVVVPVTVSYNSNYTADFSSVQFSDSTGTILQHWIGTYVSGTSAQAYIKVPSLLAGTNTFVVGKSSSNISNVTGMFNTFTNFPIANTIPAGWQLFTNGGSFTAVPATTGIAGALTLNNAGGGPISHLATTTNQGVSVAVDTFATPNINTASTAGQNSILEIVLHGNSTLSSSTLENGFKYRWDARAGTSFKGTIISQSLTSNVVTMVLDQTAFQLNTYYPAGARAISVGELISVTSNAAPFNQSSVAVSSVAYNGNQVTITYPATGANVSTQTLTSAFPTYYYVASGVLMGQAWLNNPYGGSYGTTPINDAGWSNFDETFASTAQNTTNANGIAGSPAVWRAKYVGTTGSGTFSSYVNNVPTGRNFVETGVRTTSASGYSLTSNVATIQTFPPHGLAAGDSVTITGLPAPFSGTFTVSQIVGAGSFTYSVTGANVTLTSANPYNNSSTITGSSTRFSQNGLAGVATHVGSATFNWIAIYPTFSGVSDAVYSALV